MIVAYDIGGTRIRAARVAGASVVPLGEVPTPARDFAGFVAAVGGFAAGATGLALSVAGVVDPATGRIKVANIPGANGRALGPELESALGLPVKVLNDADCFALAEAHHGAGRGHRSVFGIILGTGVGGGLVIDGQVVTGAGGFAGEWGHGPVLTGELALPCGCGQAGCLDTIGGARGIERLHALRTGETLGSEAIVAGWRAGRAAEAATVALWAERLSGPLAMVLNVVGASVVPVGGRAVAGARPDRPAGPGSPRAGSAPHGRAASAGGGMPRRAGLDRRGRRLRGAGLMAACSLPLCSNTPRGVRGV